ncbi:MAG: CoB--CoM heterodisulfide reductase iron-sulfur subunit B family protein [Desulfarculaceae bacterium]|nr:CoB--CoM heterodisulfide reductase iron-sulfur subunit B family protein [Desulfarculaceae bacterium]MCF8073900.1 CoB--CoM heterodisulfide reductase iron-sulfur subunit B family protein [Desulfarculaceae bacterium]MCF8116324.1 CoB--CoM heterodisulfide reductase iron-sulfur subunit B family protein [Desulfarculaceae bacterium]
MMKALLFLGCTVPVRNLNYELSARKVCQALGVELVDDPALACCGYPLKGSDQGHALVIAARALAQAKAHDLPLVALCSACAGTLAEAEHHLAHDPAAAEAVNRELEPLGLKYEPGARVNHLMRFLLSEVGLEAIQAKMSKSLEGFSFAPHYGCHYLKPAEVIGGLDDPENPQSMGQLIAATGARAVSHPRLKDCCGGGVLGADEELAGSLAGAKLAELNELGVTAMVLVCPFCNVMYEGQQKAIAKRLDTKFKVPVVYLTQILGLGLGLSPDEVGLKLNRVKPKELIKAFKE